MPLDEMTRTAYGLGLGRLEPTLFFHCVGINILRFGLALGQDNDIVHVFRNPRIAITQA